MFVDAAGCRLVGRACGRALFLFRCCLYACLSGDAGVSRWPPTADGVGDGDGDGGGGSFLMARQANISGYI